MRNSSREQAFGIVNNIAAPAELRVVGDFASGDGIADHDLVAGKRLASRDGPPPLHARHMETAPGRAEQDARFAQPTPLKAETLQGDFAMQNGFEDEDDPPFRAPTIWQSEALEPKAEGGWQWSERSTAAFLGFAGGILIVVPTVFFIGTAVDDGSIPQETSAIETLRPPPASETAAPTPQNKPFPFTVATAGGTWFNARVSQPAVTNVDAPSQPADVETANIAPKREPKTSEATPELSAVEIAANTAIIEGRIDDARRMLRDRASPDRPILWFRLGETYDPLTVRESDDARPDVKDVRATDVRFARYYYRQALTHGVETARARLSALPQTGARQ